MRGRIARLATTLGVSLGLVLSAVPAVSVNLGFPAHGVPRASASLPPCAPPTSTPTSPVPTTVSPAPLSPGPTDPPVADPAATDPAPIDQPGAPTTPTDGQPGTPTEPPVATAEPTMAPTAGPSDCVQAPDPSLTPVPVARLGTARLTRSADGALQVRAPIRSPVPGWVSLARAVGSAWVPVRSTDLGVVSVIPGGFSAPVPAGFRITTTSRAVTLAVQPTAVGTWALRMEFHVGNRVVATSAAVTTTVDFDLTLRPATRADVPITYRSGCPVGPASLQVLSFTYRTYDNTLQRGSIIVHRRAVAVIRRLFEASLAAGFAFQTVSPADWYHSPSLGRVLRTDPEAMAYGLTSAFFCRKVTGNPYRLSPHSYGMAIDINTFQNPYLVGRSIYPPAAARDYYYNRSKNSTRPGVITDGSIVARTLRAAGWRWGKYAFSQPDYQHFQP